MVWQEIRINTWEDFLNQINSIKSSKMVYRGQTKLDYLLESSLKREKNLFISQKSDQESIEQMLIRIESNFIKYFKSESHLYSGNDGYSDLSSLDVLSILQHYGAPTRLLDWSYSPFISTYFAINDNFNNDSVLYALDLEYINNINKTKTEEYLKIKSKPSLGQNNLDIIQFGQYYADLKARAEKKGDSFTEEIILQPYEPNKKNIRLARQQGLFLISSKIDVDYEEIISNYNISEGKILDEDIYVAKKFIINKNIKLDILKSLQLMNISSEILFPEIEGYCKGLKYKLLNNNYSVTKGEI